MRKMGATRNFGSILFFFEIYKINPKNNKFLDMSASMSRGIVDVHLPLISIGTMVSRIEFSKTLFRAHLGMQLIKCL